MSESRALNCSSGTGMQSSPSPPGDSNKAYKLESFGGEVLYIPCSKSAMRLLVTGKETENAFAVVGTGGSLNDPIGFHFHREAHDVFLCLKGSMNVWANKASRTMLPGDFASVPPVSRAFPGNMKDADTFKYRIQSTNIRSWAITLNLSG